MKMLTNGPSVVRFLKTFASACLFIGLLAHPVSAETKAMTAVDMVELKRLKAPRVSEDGKWLIYQRTQPSWAENKEVNRYAILNLHTGESHISFDPEDEKESVSKPVWATHGEGFITLLKRGEDKAKQAYYFDMSDGSLSRLTNNSGGVIDPYWAKSASGFYYRAKRMPSDVFLSDLEDKWIIEEYESVPEHELWYFDWATQKSMPLDTGAFDVRDYSLSRDGKSILFIAARNGLEDRPDSEMHLYDIQSAQIRVLTKNTFSEANPRLSPSGDKLAFIATVNAKGQNYYEDNVFVQNVESARSVPILVDEPMEMLAVEWNQTGSGLYILANTGLRTHLYHYDLASEKIEQITSGDSVVDDWQYNARLDQHTFILRSAKDPGEVWIHDSQGAQRQVTHEFAEFRNRFKLPIQTAFQWRRKSQALEGLLVYPLNYEAGVPFPLVTVTHGGPRSSAQFGSWNVSRYIPVLAGQGYGVFLPNHRGGTGYGDKFMRNMVGGYFNEAHCDVLAGIDELVRDKVVDPQQLIKMGWSAGGHMTNKLITVTDRFRAASSGAGGSDWVSLYGESDVRHNRAPWFGGAPWERGSAYRSFAKQSILKEAWRVRTPTLFFVGGSDVRVPPTQAILMYRGVKAAGAETELFVAPEQPHSFKLLSYRLFKINKELQWYAKHLNREAYQFVYPTEYAERQE